MKVNGSAMLHGPIDDVWTKLRDPQVLVRTIPGCQRLETIGEDEYKMTVTAGVASIKGTYLGTVRLTDPEPPHSFVLRASGAGNPGTVDASVTVSLADGEGGTTRLEYDADAVVGGTIAGVGQRMLSSAAKRTAGEFFTNVDAVLTRGLEAAAAEPAAESGTPGESQVAATPGAEPVETVTSPGVFEAPPAPAKTGPAAGDFLKGVLTGAGIAIVGVALGGFVGQRLASGAPVVRVFSPDVRVRAKPGK